MAFDIYGLLVFVLLLSYMMYRLEKRMQRYTDEAISEHIRTMIKELQDLEREMQEDT